MSEVLTQATKDLIVKTVANEVKVPFWVKPFLKPVTRIAVNFLDSKGSKVIPDEVDPMINNAITAGINGDFDKASESAATALNIVIDIPLLDEDHEQEMFVGGIRFLIQVVQAWIDKKKAK